MAKTVRTTLPGQQTETSGKPYLFGAFNNTYLDLFCFNTDFEFEMLIFVIFLFFLSVNFWRTPTQLRWSHNFYFPLIIFLKSVLPLETISQMHPLKTILGAISTEPLIICNLPLRLL